jgi:hypothetical protein
MPLTAIQDQGVVPLLEEILKLINRILDKAEKDKAVKKEKAEALREKAKKAVENRDYSVLHLCLLRIREL